MKIEFDLFDREGAPLNIGDKIEMFNLGRWNKESIGTGVLMFDMDDGSLRTDPDLVESNYDFFKKVLPHCVKVS